MPFDPSQAFTVVDGGQPQFQPVATPTPVTHYSLGHAVGGPDESQDPDTNAGLTATGRNLTPGVAAVNPEHIPLGSIIRDSNTGEVWLAADKHGNKDPRVVDLYQAPSEYTPEKETRNLEVIGQVDKVPSTAQGVQSVLSAFRGGAGGGGDTTDGTDRTDGTPVKPVSLANPALGNADPRQTGYFSWKDASGTEVRRPLMMVYPQAAPAGGGAPTDQTPPAEQSGSGFDPSQQFTVVNPGQGFDQSQPFTVVDPGQQPVAHEIWNSFARGATAEGFYAGTEGASRGTGMAAEGFASQNEGTPTDQLQQQRQDLITQRDNPMLPIGAQSGITDQIADIDRVLAARSSGQDMKSSREGWQAIAGWIGNKLTNYADDTHALREQLREDLPVSQQFAASMPGQISQGLGQLVGTLPTQVIPGFMPVVTAGQIYQNGYDDAIAHGMSAEDANKAAMENLPSAVPAYLLHKLVISKILAPLVGKVTIGQAAKYIAVAAAAGGADMAAQTLWANNVAKNIAKYDPNRPLTEGVVNGMILGAVANAAATGAGMAASHGLSNTPGQPSAVENRPGTGLGGVTLGPDGAQQPDAAAVHEAFGEGEHPQTAGFDPSQAFTVVSDGAAEAAAAAPAAASGGFDPSQPHVEVVDTGGLPPEGAAKSDVKFSKAAEQKVSEALHAAPEAKAATPWRVARGGSSDVLEKARKDFTDLPFRVQTRDGRTVILKHNRQGTIDTLWNHLATKYSQRTGENFVNPVLSAWIPRIPQTLEEARVKFQQPNGSTVYATKYEGGHAHFVVVKPDGEVEGHGPLDYLWTHVRNPMSDLGAWGEKPAIVFSKGEENLPMSSPEGRGGTEDAGNISGQSDRGSGSTVLPQAYDEAHHSQIESAAQAEAERMGNPARVVVHADVPEIPDHALRSAVEGEDARGTGKVNAVYDRRNNTIHLISSRLSDAAQAAAKVRHEGLHDLMETNERFRSEYEQLMGHFAQTLPADTFRRLSSAYGADPATLMEEYMAHLAETQPQVSTWRHFVSTVKQWLARWFPNVKFSEDDIRAFLHRNLARKGSATEAAAETMGMAPAMAMSKQATDEAAAADEGARRKFFESVKASEAVMPDVKQRMKEEFYTPISNKETLAQAKARIAERGIDGTLADILGQNEETWKPHAQDYAAGIELIGQLNARGRYDDAAALADKIARASTDQGRAIQALSMIAKLTPEGIELYAARQVSKAIKDNPRLQKTHGEIERLRKELKAARKQIATQAMLSATRRGTGEKVLARINRLMVDNKDSLWGRYKGGAVKALAGKLLGSDPRRPAMLEEFTQRLTRQLREQLPEPPLSAGKQDRPPMDEAAMIGEAIRNFDKYKDVWSAAQDHIREKYRDNPEALQSMDDYLGQILDKPFSAKSVDRAVKQAAQSLNIDMREVLTRPSRDKAAVRAELARLITERAGVDGETADSLARDVHAAFDAHQREALNGLLKQLSATGGTRVSKGEAQRLMELNNAGALDDSRFFAFLAKKHGVPAWTPELSAKVQRLAAEYERAKDPDVKLVTAARMMDVVGSVIPPSAWAKLRGLQNLAMLLNPKTVIRNIAGNAVMWMGDVSADTLTRWTVDPMLSLVTGQRTRTTVDMMERIKGLGAPFVDYQAGKAHAIAEGKTGFSAFSDGVKHMIDIARLTGGGKFELSKVQNGLRKTFSAPVFSQLEDTLSTLLGAPDRAFFMAAYRASIARQMAVEKAAGRAMLAPTNEMQLEAILDAQHATFQHANWLSEAANKVRSGLNLNKEWGLGTAILPFTQVPGAIALKAATWSPAGFIHAAYEVMRPVMTKDNFRQKQFADAFSRALIGSAVWATGYWLAKIGIATAMPDENKSLAEMQKASGMGAFSVNASALLRAMASGNWWAKQKAQPGDVTVNYNWISPNGVAVAAGAEFAHAQEKQRLAELQGRQVQTLAKYLSAAEAGGEAFLDQSFLSGLADAAQVTGEKGLVDGSAQLVAQMPLNFIPSVVRQIRDLSDNTVRETSAGDVLQRVQSKFVASIPGASTSLPPRYDLLGQAEERYQYATNNLWNVFLNPAFVNRYKAQPELQEAERVYRMTGEQGALPTDVAPKMQLNGLTVPLTNEEISAYDRIQGDYTRRVLMAMLASPGYASAPVGAQAKALVAGLTAAHNAAKLSVLGQQPNLVQRIRAQYQGQQHAKAAAAEIPGFETVR